MEYGLDRFYAQLELTKDLIELRHCSDNSLQFVLRLNFSNKGKGPVILDNLHKSSSAYLVSRTFENAIRKSMNLSCITYEESTPQTRSSRMR
jgi:hypothetical protein